MKQGRTHVICTVSRGNVKDPQSADRHVGLDGKRRYVPLLIGIVCIHSPVQCVKTIAAIGGKECEDRHNGNERRDRRSESTADSEHTDHLKVDKVHTKGQQGGAAQIKHLEEQGACIKIVGLTSGGTQRDTRPGSQRATLPHTRVPDGFPSAGIFLPGSRKRRRAGRERRRRPPSSSRPAMGAVQSW